MTAEIIKFDPLIALNARWHDLDAQCHALFDRGDGKGADAVSLVMVKIEDRIAALVPRSASGAAAQIRLLRQWGQDFEWNEPHDQLLDKLLAGLERIGEAQP
jgi:hypothetical protein